MTLLVEVNVLFVISSCILSWSLFNLFIAVMSFADETDPLLPGGKPSPEVMGSRPQSINTTGINEGTDNNNLVEVDESKSQSSTSRNLVRNCFIVFVVFFFATFLVQPTGWWDPQGPDQPGNPHWKPKTIEERAAKILSDTPLIGTFLLFMNSKYHRLTRSQTDTMIWQS